MAYLEDREQGISGRGASSRFLDAVPVRASVAPLAQSVPVRLSIAMAAHNEEATIAIAIERILKLERDFDLELIVVDDGSTDSTWDIVQSFDDPHLKSARHPKCRGKGAAIMTAASVATGSHILIFDADLEYDANDIPGLVEPVMDGTASIVYGARMRGDRTEFPSLTYALGGKATTVFTNVLFNSWMTDMHTCLKLMPLHLFRQLSLREAGFGLDTEMTCEILRRGYRPFEVACSYKGRSAAEGKKISARDGVECLKVAVEVRLRGRIKGANLLEPLRVISDEAETDESVSAETLAAAETATKVRPRRRRRATHAGSATHVEAL